MYCKYYMKTFDLSKNYNFTKDLQNNLKIVKKEFGTKFYIKTKKFKVPVILTLKTLKFKKDVKFYELKYNVKRMEFNMYPFLINFYNNNINPIVGNNAHINNIIKTDKISGSNIVKIVMEILKKLNTKKVTLYDGTRVDCKDKQMELTWFKLIEKKRGYYEKFGFKYDVLEDWRKNYFKNSKQLYDYLYTHLDTFRKLKIINYNKIYIDIIKLISEVIINQDFENVDVGVKYGYGMETLNNDMINQVKFKYLKKNEVKKYLLELIENINDMLNIFKNTKQTLLYKLMIELFNDKSKCSEYLKLWDNLVNSKLYLIKYKNNKLVFENSYLIDYISVTRFTILSYTFY